MIWRDLQNQAVEEYHPALFLERFASFKTQDRIKALLGGLLVFLGVVVFAIYTLNPFIQSKELVLIGPHISLKN
jgi:hypothetical protein